MRAEADEQQEERRDLHLPRDESRRRRHRECLEVERAHPRLVRAHIEEEHTEQHECRADEEEHRHLHRRVLLRDAFRRAPDEHHQVRGHDDHLAEHEKEEHVAHEERPRNAPDDDEEEDEILLDAFLDVPRAKDRREPDDAREKQHGQRDAVHAERIGDAEVGDPRNVLRELHPAPHEVVVRIDVKDEQQRECHRRRREPPDRTVQPARQERDDARRRERQP